MNLARSVTDCLFVLYVLYYCAVYLYHLNVIISEDTEIRNQTKPYIHIHI